MSHVKHHRGLHHIQNTGSSAVQDASGWVEGITALNEEHPATALMHTDPVTGLPSPQIPPTKTGVNGGVNGSQGPQTSSGSASETAPAHGNINGKGAGGNGGTFIVNEGAVAGVVNALTPEEEFDACLDHALGVMAVEVSQASHTLV